MCITFLVRTKKLYHFPKVEKEKLNLEKCRDAVYGKKFRSDHKTIAYIQHEDHSFSNNFFACLETKKYAKNVVSDF